MPTLLSMFVKVFMVIEKGFTSVKYCTSIIVLPKGEIDSVIRGFAPFQ